MDKQVPPARPSQAETEDEIDVEDAFSEHDIACWVREGKRLVPATPAQLAAMWEREALLRLAVWRSNSFTRRLLIDRPRYIGQYVRHWFSLPRAPHTPDIPDTIDIQSLTSRSDSHQEATRERHV